MRSGPVPDPVELVVEREEFLALLADEPLRKRAIVDRLEPSRSTVDRAVKELDDAGLIEWTGGGYETTVAGRLALERYRAFVAEERTVLDARSILERFPPGCDLPLSLLSGGETLEADPSRLFEVVAARVRTASECRLVLPALPDSRLLRLLHARVVRDAVGLDLLVAPRLRERLREEFPRLAADLAASESATVHEVSAPPYGLMVTGDGTAVEDPPRQAGPDESVASIDEGATSATDGPAQTEGTPTVTALALDDDEFAAVVHSDDPDAVRWGIDEQRSLRAAGRDVTDALAEADADLSATAFGAETPRGWAALHGLGFDRVDAAYFTERTPRDPAMGWKVGFDLVDVYYGYAFDRVDHRGDGDPDQVVDRLAERLQSGEPHVVLGPPGTGKSTVCRAVACRWVESDLGMVLYRRSPTEGGLDAIGPIVDAVESADEQVLVVVEDATGEGVAARLRNLVRRYRDDPDVNFLLEARDHDWESLGTGTTRDLGELVRAVEEYRLPTLDEGTCRRAIETFEAATGRSVPLDAAELHDRIAPEQGVGEMYLLSYQLLAHTSQPGTDEEGTPTGIETEVAAVRDRLAPEGEETLPLEVGVLVTTLIAAELPVRPGAVHAVAAARDDRTAHRRVDNVLDDLTGQVLFDADDDYRTQHPFWAVLFLKHALEQAERATVMAFEAVVNALFALADQPERRDRIEEWLGRESPTLDRFRDESGAGSSGADAGAESSGQDSEASRSGADALVRRVFEVTDHHSDLAPLFGTTDLSGIEFPEACTPATELWCIQARAGMWFEQGEFDRAAEEYDRLEQRAETAPVDDETRARFVCRAHKGRGDIAQERSELEAQRRHWEEALSVARSAGLRRNEVDALNGLGWAAREADEYETAEQYLAEAEELATDLDDVQPLSVAYYNQGAVALSRGDFERAEELLKQSLALDRERGDRAEEASTLNVLGIVAADREAHDRAEEYFRRAITAKREVGDRAGLASVLSNYGGLLADRGALDAAADHLEEALELAREIGMPRREADMLSGMGTVDRKRGNYEEAAQRHRDRREIYREVGYDQGAAMATADLGRVARDRGDLDEAVRHFQESLDELRELGVTRRVLEVVEHLIDLSERREDDEAAVEWCETGIDLAADAGLADRRASFEDRRKQLLASAGE